MNSILKYFKETKWIIISTFFLGLILILASELFATSLFTNFLLHVGMAFMISGIIGGILEVTEIKEFFEKRLTAIILNNDFIDLLSEEKVINLIQNSIVGLGRNRLHQEVIDYHDLARTIATNIDPHIGKPYRKDFFERLEYYILTADEIKEIDIEPQTLKHGIAKFNSATQYTIICPLPDKEMEHVLNFSWDTWMVPGLSPEEQMKAEVFCDGEKLAVPIKIVSKPGTQMTSLKINHQIIFSNQKHIEIKLTSFEKHINFGYIYRRMTALTKCMNFHFSSREELNIDAEVFGMISKYDQFSVTNNSVSIHYPDWALPGHGYFVSWEIK